MTPGSREQGNQFLPRLRVPLLYSAERQPGRLCQARAIDDNGKESGEGSFRVDPEPILTYPMAMNTPAITVVTTGSNLAGPFFMASYFSHPLILVLSICAATTTACSNDGLHHTVPSDDVVCGAMRTGDSGGAVAEDRDSSFEPRGLKLSALVIVHRDPPSKSSANARTKMGNRRLGSARVETHRLELPWWGR